LREVWKASAVDRHRIPANSTPLRILWALSNWTDRLVLLAVLLAAPTFLQVPLRAIAKRPTRRYGFYLVVAALCVVAVLA
jgi:hypothetical protein